MNGYYYLTCLSALVAACVAWVGVQQWRLARDRLKFDLWEKRYAIYKATQKFLSEVIQNGTSNIDGIFGFSRDTQDAYFLFQPDMEEYLRGLYKKGVDVRTARKVYTAKPNGEERDRLIEKEAGLVAELSEELESIKFRFAPYLRLPRE